MIVAGVMVAVLLIWSGYITWALHRAEKTIDRLVTVEVKMD